MDLVLCIDYTSSLKSYYKQLRKMVQSIFSETPKLDQGDVRIAVVKYRLPQNIPSMILYGFTEDSSTIERSLSINEPDQGSRNGYGDLGTALHEVLNIDWRQNSNNGATIKKLVILITDNAPNGLFTELTGLDPWIMSKEFVEKDITLVVVGIGEGIFGCYDFYCALAHNTGGKYIPMVNAQRLIPLIITSVMIEGITFPLALSRVAMEDIEKNSSFKYWCIEDLVDGLINECQTMNDIYKIFEHRRPGI